LTIEKHLSHQTPLVLSFIDCEKVFELADRRALAKILSFYGIPDKYIKVISTIFGNNNAAVKVENEISGWFRIKSRVKKGHFISPFMVIILMEFVLSSTAKTVGEHGIKWRSKTLLDLHHVDDLSFLDENVCKINELSEVLQLQGARTDFNII